MSRNTSVTLGEHFEGFISEKIEQGRFGSKSEAVRAGMRLLEEHEKRVEALNLVLIEGEDSGNDGLLNMSDIIREAKDDARSIFPDA